MGDMGCDPAVFLEYEEAELAAKAQSEALECKVEVFFAVVETPFSQDIMSCTPEEREEIIRRAIYVDEREEAQGAAGSA